MIQKNNKSSLSHKFSMSEEIILPAWVWGQEPNVIVKGQHVLFKSMPVFVKSDGTSHPDARTLAYKCDSERTTRPI